jgi:hypothetical protein
VGVVLPDALAWVLNLIGIDWPNIDEDELRSAASELRTISGELTSNTGDAQSQIEQMLGANSAQSLELFQALWNKLAAGHLPQLGEGMNLLADGLDVSAVVVVGLKLGAIAQLAILAAEIIADQAAAPFTFGASEAAIPVETEATSQIVKQIVKNAVDQVEQQLISAVEGPVFSALDSAAQEMAGQLLGDALGVHSGVDLGSVASAGGSGFEQGVQDSENQVTHPFGGGGSSDTGGGDTGGGDTGSGGADRET